MHAPLPLGSSQPRRHHHRLRNLLRQGLDGSSPRRRVLAVLRPSSSDSCPRHCGAACASSSTTTTDDADTYPPMPPVTTLRAALSLASSRVWATELRAAQLDALEAVLTPLCPEDGGGGDTPDQDGWDNGWGNPLGGSPPPSLGSRPGSKVLLRKGGIWSSRGPQS